MIDASALNPGNASYLDALYESFLENPESVDPAWRRYFEQVGAPGGAPTPMQLGGVRALREGHGWLEEARALYREAGLMAARALWQHEPDGSTFLFIDTTNYLPEGATDCHPFLERCADSGRSCISASVKNNRPQLRRNPSASGWTNEWHVEITQVVLVK